MVGRAERLGERKMEGYGEKEMEKESLREWAEGKGEGERWIKDDEERTMGCGGRDGVRLREREMGRQKALFLLFRHVEGQLRGGIPRISSTML